MSSTKNPAEARVGDAVQALVEAFAALMRSGPPSVPQPDQDVDVHRPSARMKTVKSLCWPVLGVSANIPTLVMPAGREPNHRIHPVSHRAPPGSRTHALCGKDKRIKELSGVPSPRVRTSLAEASLRRHQLPEWKGYATGRPRSHAAYPTRSFMQPLHDEQDGRIARRSTRVQELASTTGYYRRTVSASSAGSSMTMPPNSGRFLPRRSRSARLPRPRRKQPRPPVRKHRPFPDCADVWGDAPIPVRGAKRSLIAGVCG